MHAAIAARSAMCGRPRTMMLLLLLVLALALASPTSSRTPAPATRVAPGWPGRDVISLDGLWEFGMYSPAATAPCASSSHPHIRPHPACPTNTQRK